MIPSALTERWQGMFCMDALANSFDFEYWDCSDICQPSFESSTSLERNYARKISNVTEMEENLRRLPKDTVIFSHIHLEGYNYKLHQLISSYIRNRVYIDFWANRISLFVEGNVEKDFKASKQSLVQKIEPTFTFARWNLSSSLKKIPLLYYLVKYMELGGGSKYVAFRDEDRKLRRYYKAVPLYNRFLITVKPHTTYSINHPDYEKYLSVKENNESPLVDGRYVVYLDQCFPMHPSLKTENPDVDFESLAYSYYESMNHFFEKVERQYGCEVVIAGHPIANYEKNPFGGRKIIYFKTAELVASSVAVLIHCSFSVSFPILFDKPFCILSNSAIRNATEVRNNIERFSCVFKQPIIDTDYEVDVEGIFLPLSREIRERYINMFFDTSIREKNSELLANHIISIHDKILANDK